MAKVKFSDDVEPVRNKHYGFTFQNQHYGNSMFVAPKGRNQRSNRQFSAMQNIQKAIRQWRNMSADVQNSWNQFAEDFPQPAKKTGSQFLTGYQLFLKRNSYCFLNHGIESDFLFTPQFVEFVPSLPVFSIKSGANVIEVTQPYIRNFGILPKPGQSVILWCIA
jgi:hypothetical protein